VKLISAMLGLSLMAGTAAAKEATSELKFPAMDCPACTVVIRKALTQIKGVRNVDLNVDKRTATIVYEDTQVTEAQIEKAIERAGFKAERSN
jgi:copper chaperone CopZ